MKSLPAVYDRISILLEPYQAYLVGGAVRDLLLEKHVHDLDFALPEDPINAARSVADQLGGAFFVLDPERETARVILIDDHGQRMMVDFTLFQGKNIEEDLFSRDFTITSMALEVGGDNKIIDPVHGAQDLKDGLLRATSDSALEDDPLRCLRAVRLAAQFGLKILPDTKDQIRKNGRKLVEISPERIRDELFRILAGPRQTAAFQSIEILGLAPFVLSDNLDGDQLSQSRSLEELWFIFLKEHNQESAANWSLALMVHRLGRYRTDLRSYLEIETVPGRKIYHLSFIAALFKDRIAGLGEDKLKSTLALSNDEWGILLSSNQAADKMHKFYKKGDDPQPLDVYRYYRQHGSEGVLGVFMALSVISADHKNKADQEGWITILGLARYFLEGWWEKNNQWVNPPLLLNGDDIQTLFELEPGPRIGELLISLRESQVERGISTREDAINFLTDLLNLGNEII